MTRGFGRGLSLSALNIHSLLLDIEGTTTPIAFVYEVLFPFARACAEEFLTARFEAADVQLDLAKLREEHAADVTQGFAPPPLSDSSRAAQIESIVAYVHWLMHRDRKSTGLKSLQGKIWEQGYRDGTLKAQVFADVAPALERWHSAGMKISIFSSGSVLAQRLLFAHTEAGDLTRLLDSYFDTMTGGKTDEASYRRIASALELPSAETLFISDVVKELDAAREAGMRTLFCDRPGNHPQPPASHQLIHSFDEIRE